MTSRLASVLITVLCGCAAFGAASAGAGTEIGSQCDPTSGAGESGMAIQLSRVTPPVALKTTSPGVVTSWKVQSAPFLEPRTMALKVIRQVGDEYEVVAESGPGSVLGKPHQFATRIPVPAGVSFGVSSTKSFPACDAFVGDTVGLFAGAGPVGSKAKPIENRTERVLSLGVVVEPDADGDGFGDETQDQCPQSTATQGACLAPPPPGGGVGGATVKLKGKPKLEGNVVAVKLTTSVATKLTATGSIRGKRAAAPVTKTVSPGETGRLYLSLKKSVKQRLANLPRKRKLRMVVEVKAAGAPTVSAEISLPGRKKQSS
jgi:hypothetical protein